MVYCKIIFIADFNLLLTISAFAKIPPIFDFDLFPKVKLVWERFLGLRLCGEGCWSHLYSLFLGEFFWVSS